MLARCTSQCKDCEESYCIVSEDGDTQIKTKCRKRADEWFMEITSRGEEVFLMFCCHKRDAMVTLRHYLKKTHGHKPVKARTDKPHETKAVRTKGRK